MARLKVNLHGEHNRGISIDGHKIDRVRSLSFHVDVNSIPTATMEVIGCDDFCTDISSVDMIHHIYPCGKINEYATFIVEMIKNDNVIREGFIASIASALKECEMPFADERYVAEKVLQRIIGEN